MRKLRSIKNNIFTVQLLDVMYEEDNNCLFIVMEYVQFDLKKILKSTVNIEFDEDHVITIMYNSLCALNFLHSINIMHRDIKPANILINEDCVVKICDFGLSRTVPSNQINLQNLNVQGNDFSNTNPKNEEKYCSPLGLDQESLS